jgi:porin
LTPDLPAWSQKAPLRRTLSASAALWFAVLAASAALARPTVQASGYANVDVASVSGPQGARRTVELDKEELDLDVAFAGANGPTAHISVQNESGGSPNAIAGALQGVNNIEVDGAHPRLFEAWVQQPFAGGRASVRAGLYDVNSEFDVTPSAALLLAPTFGISSEFAAAGPAGTPTYPETSLAVRLDVRLAEHLYARVAAANAQPRGLGDRGGIDTRFDAGVLIAGEAGIDGDNQLAIGVWRFSRRQDDLFDADGLGNPLQRSAQGVYVLAARRFAAPDNDPRMTVFFRGGLSDGRTSPFSGAAEAGVLVEHVLPGRPDSSLAAGAGVAALGEAYRAASAATGTPLQSAETQLEVTYSDTLAPHVQIQPDLQYTFHPGGRPGVGGAFVATVRFTVSFGPDE